MNFLRWRSRITNIGTVVLRALGIDRAHLVGLSMGGTATIEFGIRHPDMALSLSAAGCGGGASTDPTQRRKHQEDCAVFADRLEREGIAAMAELYCAGPARVQYRLKDPRGWEEFKRQFAAGSAHGRALTMLGVQGRRAPFFERQAELNAMTAPVLVIAGDEDHRTHETSLLFKAHIRRCGLLMLPKTGHTINLEEPAAFNAAVEEFIHAVERDAWGERDPIAKEKYLLVPTRK